jgi:diguanylate cyclase (GGDEF)-like protein
VTEDRRAGASELKSLARRLADLERERADAVEANRLLLALQEVETRIAGSHDPNEIVAQLLRAMREPLGFSRAIYFSADRARGIEARLQVDGSETVEPSDESLDLEAQSAVLGALRGEREPIGFAGELCAPLVDVRGWYVLCPLSAGEAPVGVVYVDGHRSRRPREWEVTLVRSLAAISAAAIGNAALFTRTQELAARDPLTGLFNRRAFEARLHELIEQSQRTFRPFAYVMIDVDDFKTINDRHGHAYGDEVLQSLAAALTANSRAEDVVGRYAGDEFAVIMANVDRDLARVLVARLCGDLNARNLKCSLGVALFPIDAGDARSLMEAADRALYNTKAAGKNGFSFY